MAYEGGLQTIPGAIASGDLSSDQFKFVKQTASGMSLSVVNGQATSGILQNKPAVAGAEATVAFGGASKVRAGAAFADGARIMADITGRAITAAAGPTAASKAGGAETYALTAGQTVIVDVDNIGGATGTFDAAVATVTDTTTYTGGAAATITDTTTYAVTDQDGLTSIVTQVDAVNGTTVTTVTFAGVTTTALQIAAQMNDQVPHVSAVVTGGQVVLTTDEVGVDCTIAVAAGTGGLTWAAATAGTGGLADQDGLTSVITVDGGSAQTVTFSGVTTEVAQVAAQLNDGVTGASATVTGGQVVISTDSLGTGSSLVAAAGTGALTWDTPVAGTGDAVDISAVTAAEFETVIEADTTATVTVAGGIPTVFSPTTGITSELDFTGGTALTTFGLSIETLNGSASGTLDQGFAMEAASAAGDIVTMVIQPSGKI